MNTGPRSATAGSARPAGLAELIAKSSDGPKVLISASAIGYYGYDRGDETLTEDSERGDGFLADVVADWEHATAPGRAGR